MNYHAEHHLFPGVPAQHLPEVQRRLSTSSRAPQRLLRGSYVGALARHVSALD
jgi:fatty acid desaturase